MNVIAILTALFFMNSPVITPPGSGYAIGDIAEDFNLKNIDGEMVSLSQFDDAEGYIVIFTCNSCPWAVKYEDRIKALHEKYSASGFPVIAINPNDPTIKPEDSFDNMIVRAEEKGFEFPYLFDEKQEVFPKYGATKTPHVYVLDKDRKVSYIGAIDDSPSDVAAVEVNFVDNAVEAISKGTVPEPSITKAIGCSIKSKNGKKGDWKKGKRGKKKKKDS